MRKLWFLLKEKMLGRETMAELKILESIQACDPQQRRSRQERDFLSVWNQAWKSPYYRSRFKQENLSRNSIQGLDDIRKLPILTKADFRENADTMLCEDVRPEELFTTRTSGSTGQRLVFQRSRKFGSHNFAQCLRGRRWWGVQPWSTMAKFWGVAWQFEDTRVRKAKAYLKYIKDRFIGTIHFSAFDVTKNDLEKVAVKVEKFRPDVLFGYGSALFMFARHCLDRGGMNHQFKVAIYTSEALTEYQKETIGKAFKCPVVSEYGSVETGIISYACPEGKHHISEENIILEILDDKDEPVEEGEKGRAIITVLHERAIPILRYDLGDILSLDPDTKPCKCGINLKSIQILSGRANDLIQSSKGSFVHPELFDYTMRYFPGVERFRIVELDTDKIEVILQCPGEVDKKRLDQLRTELSGRLKGEFEVIIRTTSLIKNESSGKYRWVIKKAKSL